MTLSEHDQILLDSILEQTLETSNGVSRGQFRAAHMHSLLVLDALEANRALEWNTNYDTYRIPLATLPLLTSKCAKRIRDDAEKLYKILADSYTGESDTRILLNDLRKQTKLPRNRLTLCIRYLIEGGCFAGYTTDLTEPDASVGLAERIIHFKNFHELIEERQSYWFPQPVHNKESKVHGNSQVNAKKREQVLGAAITIMANYPKECQNKAGKWVGARIAQLAYDHSYKLFNSEEPPLSVEIMAKLINNYLKFPA